MLTLLELGRLYLSERSLNHILRGGLGLRVLFPQSRSPNRGSFESFGQGRVLATAS
jgi:hypothetical protein